MTGRFSSSLGEGKIAWQLLEALGCSLDIRVVLKEIYPLLTQLAPADYGALGVSSSPHPESFEWTVAELPLAFFAAYPEMAEHDFVRRSVLKQPNRVLADQDMVSRRELEQNVMYRRAREVGAPIEQVMAVMLHVDERWQSGLSLYRERRRPFSARERARLQRVTPALANAVRNCQLFGVAADWQLALERLLTSPEASLVLVAVGGAEIGRSPTASPLIEKWFAPHERRGSGLPEPLAAAFDAALGTGRSAAWHRRGPGARLEVSFLPLTGYFGAARWVVQLEERADGAAVPERWRVLLSKRELEVTSGVLQGWDNRLIGQELRCAEATVKKHLQRIFEKLGVESRTALVARAAQRRRD